MKPEDYPVPVRESWAFAQLFRKLGFTRDEIHLEVVNTINAVPEPGRTLNVVLRAQERQFVVVCSEAMTEDEGRELAKQSREFVLKVNAEEFDSDLLDAVWKGSKASKGAARVMEALIVRGFRLPFMAN